MEIITTTPQLEMFCSQAKTKSCIGIDTEFVRHKTYYAKLCLVQLIAEDTIVIIDPLSKDICLSALYALLVNERVAKIFHAARQDLEIFYKERQGKITPLWDTQIMAGMLGYGEQMGYTTLVKTLLNCHIDKKERVTDWTKRPLTSEQLKYAIEDVKYLPSIYKILKKQMVVKARTSWIEEEISILNSPETYKANPYTLYRRLKTTRKNRIFLAILQEIVAIREHVAMRDNIPRQHVIKDEELIELARVCPTAMKEVKRIKNFPYTAIKRKNPTVLLQIVEGINTVLHRKKDTYPEPVQSSLLDPREREILCKLKGLRQEVSHAVGIAPNIIAHNQELKSIASGNIHTSAFKSWRNTIFGKRALKLVKDAVPIKKKLNIRGKNV